MIIERNAIESTAETSEDLWDDELTRRAYFQL